MLTFTGAGFQPDTRITFTVAGNPLGGDLNDPPYVFTDSTAAFDSSASFDFLTFPTAKVEMLDVTATDGVRPASFDDSVYALCNN